MDTMRSSIIAAGNAAALVERDGWGYLLWILAAALLGFGICRIFAGQLHLPRRIYLIPYVVMVSLFLYGFLRWSELSLTELFRRNWVWGVTGAVVVGAFLVRNILSQPASPRLKGPALVFDLLWSGIVYGLVDALLLSVLPVLAVLQAFSVSGWTDNLLGKIGVSILAFGASLFVTICYHLGYPEYRLQKGVIGPSIGNGIMTLGYLLTNNPITAIFSHMAMHVAGVMRGPESVTQLPPHYK